MGPEGWTLLLFFDQSSCTKNIIKSLILCLRLIFPCFFASMSGSEVVVPRMDALNNKEWILWSSFLLEELEGGCLFFQDGDSNLDHRDDSLAQSSLLHCNPHPSKALFFISSREVVIICRQVAQSIYLILKQVHLSTHNQICWCWFTETDILNL